jgi:hypothetical protein
MPSTLTTNIALSGDHWLITGELEDGGTLPKEVFIYTNSGDETLGEYYGTCNVQELGRLPIFTPGQAIPLFGNKYVRYGQIKIKVPLSESPQSVVSAIVTKLKQLSVAYANQTTSSTSYNIP